MPVENVIIESPRIPTVPETMARPLWSVMIPTYNAGELLRTTLQSVLAQDPGPDRMQIEVVDNCSTNDDPETLAKSLAGDRVSFYRRAQNDGPIVNFNECIRRSRGHLVHILHSDDYVLPGFYQEVERLGQMHPDTALLATRCFAVDEAGVIKDVSQRVRELEAGGHCARPLYYDTVMQFPSVVIRRKFYEEHGGFLPHIVHAADREMWARAISLGGGVISTEVLSCYRVSKSNESAKMFRTGENVRDLLRVAEVFRRTYPDFSPTLARQMAAYLALQQAHRFSAINDQEAAQNNLKLWQGNGLWLDRVKEFIRPMVRKVSGRSAWQASSSNPRPKTSGRSTLRQPGTTL